MGGPSIQKAREHINRPLEQIQAAPIHNTAMMDDQQPIHAEGQHAMEQMHGAVQLANAPANLGEDAALEPAEAPVMQAPIVKEHMTKAEKKAYKNEQKRIEEERVQQELERKEQARLAEIQRIAEENAQRERERQENLERQEAYRQEMRKKLFNDDGFRTQFAALAVEKDAAKARLMVENLTKKAAEVLLQDEEFKEATALSVDYTEMIMPQLCARALHGTDSPEDVAALEETKKQFKNMKELNTMGQISNVIENYVNEALSEEFANLPVFQRNASLFEQKNLETRHREMQQVNQLGKKLSTRMGAASSRAMIENPIMRDAMKGASYMAFKTILERKIGEGLDDDTAMNETIEEMKVQKLRRREAALEQNYQNKNVSGADLEHVKTYGMASTGTVVIPEDAQMYILASKGFIGGEVMPNGNVHLFPTLPEIVKSGGGEIALRKTYTHFQRLMTRALIGETGTLRKNSDGTALLQQLLKELGDLSGNAHAAISPNIYAAEFKNKVLPHLEALIKEEAQEREIQGDPEFVRTSVMEMTDMFLKGKNTDNPDFSYSALICSEYLQSWEDFISLKETIDEMPLQARLEVLEEQMKQPGFMGDKEKVLSEAEKETMRQAMRQFYRDSTQATGELISIRSISLDTAHVPLVNACSAHANLTGLMRRTFSKETALLGDPTHEMFAATYISKHPEKAFQFFKDNEFLSAEFLEKRAEKERAAEGKAVAFSSEEMEALKNCGETYKKFSYHTSSDFKVGGKIVTTETFAAETTQYCVSPITVNGAVGIYHTNDGFQEYYTADSPFATASENQVVKLKNMLNSIKRAE